MSAPTVTRRLDYQPPAFLIDHVALRFELDELGTEVHATLEVRRNPAAEPGADLILDGDQLELIELSLDGETVPAHRFVLEEQQLRIRDVPDAFSLATRVVIHPEHNTALEGLYRSGAQFCTQCEAQGFRNITWYLDRPDVMARFRTTIVADRALYPVMLANGNPVERGQGDDARGQDEDHDSEGGRHWITWDDPHPKPAYLFALVAGDLACIEDHFRTQSGRDVSLRIYVEHHNQDRCEHAMQSLKKAMRWDEERYGLEYDLDVFMIVAVDDFNMGAMENKGLNIFNSKYVLARPDTATDQDYAAIEAVIAHEYFHNWTGNRVTLRDWFQLSLKEGLTVFRDQQFSADVGLAAVNRIEDVRILRTHQFAEDAGPIAHPVRPDAYIEISNFYTVTIYNKGAEVIRMMHTLLGSNRFRAGMDLYFQRHDGEAVTTDDFVAAMQDASGEDLAQFKRWYAQAGTPEVTVRGEYDAPARRFRLHVGQRCPATPDQSDGADGAPMHIPLKVALIDQAGGPIRLRLEGETHGDATERVLNITEDQQTLCFVDVPSRPIASIGRGFSAPIKLNVDHDETDLAFLIGHDSDPFNRWDAAQEYATTVLTSLLDARREGRDLEVPDAFVQALARTLRDDALDPALIAQTLTLPSESYLADRVEVIDPDSIHAVREWLRAELARRLEPDLRARHRSCSSNEPYAFEPGAAGLRALRNLCLAYLIERRTPEVRALCTAQFDDADNMTDSLAALRCLVNIDGDERARALDAFEQRWAEDPLVIAKWLSLQALSRRPDVLERVKALTHHRSYDAQNPNKIYALLGAFCHGNQVGFHRPDGAGYRFTADRIVALDAVNPQVAARLTTAFSRWQRLEPGRREAMRQELERIVGTADLSRDVYEIASKTLSG